MTAEITCLYCKRSLIEINLYGQRLMGCIECNRWSWRGGNSFLIELFEEDLQALRQRRMRSQKETAPRIALLRPLPEARTCRGTRLPRLWGALARRCVYRADATNAGNLRQFPKAPALSPLAASSSPRSAVGVRARRSFHSWPMVLAMSDRVALRASRAF